MGSKFSLSRLKKHMENGTVPTINTTTEVVTTETVTNQTITNLTSSTALFTGAVTFQGGVTGLSNTSLIVGVDGTTAAAGSAVGDAAALPSGSTFYMVSSDNDNKGVKINAGDAVLGKVMYLINDSVKKSKVYPNTGATIDGTTFADLNAGKVLTVGYYATNKWFIIKSA